MTDTTSTTATVLFTDVVDSTALRARVGDETADRIRRSHDEAVGHAVAANNGTVVKSLGDGLMATFDAAADAVAASVEAQQAIARLGPSIGEPISIRIGVSVGDVTH